MIQQVITSFIASAGFGLLFNAPKNTLASRWIIGMIGWICYFILVEKGLDSVVASVIAALCYCCNRPIFCQKV